MALNGTESRSGRETRLLVLVVGVAIAVLLLLARWRFPGSDISVVSPSAAPLAGLAARATFDEMANTMADVLGRVSASVIVVPLVPAGRENGDEQGARTPGQATPRGRGESAAEAATTVTLAIRVRPNMALVHIPAGMMPESLPDMTIDVVAHDAAREMMLLRVAASSSTPDTLSASVRTFPGFTYAAAVTATRIGPTIQPVFIGRADTVNDPRWSHPLVPASVGPGLTPGTLLFSINSRFVGMVVGTAGGAMVVPAPALETLMLALEAGGPPR